MSLKFIANLLNKNKKNNDEDDSMLSADSINNSKKNVILRKENIKLNLETVDKYEAIRMAGRLLVEGGYVNEDYIEAMIQRENDLTTYIGNGVAIPHGVGKAKEFIKKSGIVVLQFPNGIYFDEEKAYLLIGIAGIGNEHLDILSNIATIIGDDEDGKLEKIWKTKDINFIYETFITN